MDNVFFLLSKQLKFVGAILGLSSDFFYLMKVENNVERKMFNFYFKLLIKQTIYFHERSTHALHWDWCKKKKLNVFPLFPCVPEGKQSSQINKALDSPTLPQKIYSLLSLFQTP